MQQVVNKVEPGLVVIDTTLQYNGEAAAGTGMVINPDGLVLTNSHVIEDSTSITATVVATGKTHPATRRLRQDGRHRADPAAGRLGPTRDLSRQLRRSQDQ